MNLCQVAHSKNGMNAEHSCQIEKTISKSAAAVLGRGSAFHCIAFTPLAQKSGMTYPINTTNTAKSRIDTMLNIKPDFEILLRYPFLKDTTAKTQAKTASAFFPRRTRLSFFQTEFCLRAAGAVEIGAKLQSPRLCYSFSAGASHRRADFFLRRHAAAVDGDGRLIGIAALPELLRPLLFKAPDH